MKIFPHIAAMILAVSVEYVANAQVTNLSNQALFLRCYAQFTQMRPADNHPLLLQVIAGTKDPVTACLQVLNKGLWTSSGNTRLPATPDEESLAVVQTFHKVHTTWFDIKESAPVANSTFSAGTKDLLDQEVPALHFTQALFKPSASFSKIVTANASLRPIRTTQSPTSGPASNGTKTESIFGNAVPWTATGDLLGARDISATELAVPYSYVEANDATVKTPAVNLGQNFGGGFIGEQTYLLQTFGLTRTFTSNGAERMPRKFGRSLFHDALCRQLPVIRTEDAIPFVVATSNVPFRTSSGCVRCHASMDRVSATARNLVYLVRGIGTITDGPFRGFEILVPHSLSQMPAEATWPSAADNSYYRRPTNGVFYFRNYLGNLVNTNVSSLDALGDVIAAQDDFYICAAKRYYHYLTGIDVSIADVSDPAGGVFMSQRDSYHRDVVIELGLGLKESQSSRSLIEAILRLPAYKRTDFGAGLNQ
jgi:hypothetical protein